MLAHYFFSTVFNNPVYRKAAFTALLTSMGMVANVSAQEQWARQLGAFPTCTACHTSQPGNGGTVRPEARAAFNQGGVDPGLKDFLASVTANAKPVLLPIDNQWNVQVGEVPLTIPLIVKDKEADKFAMELVNAGSATAPKGHSFSKVYTVPKINLPAIDFMWKPTSAQKNKNYTVNFRAKETTPATANQFSNTVKANIFVWPPRAQSAKNVVSQFIVGNAKWGANKLTMTGRVVFKKTASITARATALRSLRLNLKSNRGVAAGTPVLLKPNAATGAWTATFALTRTKVPCLVKAEYEKLNAARTVTSAPAACIK